MRIDLILDTVGSEKRLSMKTPNRSDDSMMDRALRDLFGIYEEMNDFLALWQPERLSSEKSYRFRPSSRELK